MSVLLPGTEVQARGLRWEIVFSQSLGAQVLYRLRGLHGAFKGEEVELLSPFETIQPTYRTLDPEHAGPIRNWLLYHQAFLLEQALGPTALLSVQPGRLKLEPYQLVPVLRAIRMSRVRLMLADSVGLGKTIQAGLVLTELMARRLAHRVLIVSPAGPLLEQWQTEMSERFGLRLDVLDRARLEEIRRENELGANPFDHAPLALVSMDFLKQERILDQLDRASYDVVIIDECHHCMDLGVAQDREDSQRRRLAEVLARRSDSLLLLTATPHDGNDRSFSSLCELLDPSLLDGRGGLRGDAYKAHVVRRLKSHIFEIDPVTKEKKEKFKKRQVLPCPVTAVPARHPDFIRLQKMLLDLIAPELRRAFRSHRYSDVLAFISLLKRSVSTVAACRKTLQVVADRFNHLLTESSESQESRRQRLKTLREYHRKLDRFGITSQQEAEQQEILEAEDLAQQLADLERQIRAGSRGLTKAASVVETLDELVTLADAAMNQDPKLQEVHALVQGIRREDPAANVLIYTEYTDSLDALAKYLNTGDVGEILTMTGDDNNAVRRRTTERFRTQQNLLLISTDAAAEGLNLHQQCHHLIHLELPFNPNRLEQRNGRIDRYGQEKVPVVRYTYLRGTFEERILLRLIVKYERQRARLTFVPNTLGLDTSTEIGSSRLLKGLMEEDTRLFQQQEPIPDLLANNEPEASDDATRELLEEIDRSLKSFEHAARTHAWLGDAGLNAEEKLLHEADEARERGSQAGAVDLALFVRDAVRFDGGNADGSAGSPVFTVTLPPVWSHGMEESIGYDPETRTIRLTTDIDVTSDAAKRPVAFLGRAHPLVRRALDRVRSISYGRGGDAGQDHRISAVRLPVAKPELLYTFLGRIVGGAGRELERVLAVRLPQGGVPEVLPEADQWSKMADPERGIRTAEVWKRFFVSWANSAAETCRETAAGYFNPVAADFTAKHCKALAKEQAELDAWLAVRAKQITGDPQPVAVQAQLFSQEEATTSPQAAWPAITDPAERLVKFYADSSRPHAARSEADGVLRLYRQRIKDLASRMNVLDPEIVPVGLLMIVPETEECR
jgi:superfamily II DNA or RNA helicase